MLRGYVSQPHKFTGKIGFVCSNPYSFGEQEREEL
jgi:hypothetical protein